MDQDSALMRALRVMRDLSSSDQLEVIAYLIAGRVLEARIAGGREARVLDSWLQEIAESVREIMAGAER